MKYIRFINVKSNIKSVCRRKSIPLVHMVVAQPYEKYMYCTLHYIIHVRATKVKNKVLTIQYYWLCLNIPKW